MKRGSHCPDGELRSSSCRLRDGPAHDHDLRRRRTRKSPGGVGRPRKPVVRHRAGRLGELLHRRSGRPPRLQGGPEWPDHRPRRYGRSQLQRRRRAGGERRAERTEIGVALDSAGNIFIVDWQNARLRRVDSTTGVITTVAGTGVQRLRGRRGAGLGRASSTGPTESPWTAPGTSSSRSTGNGRIRKVDGERERSAPSRRRRNLRLCRRRRSRHRLLARPACRRRRQRRGRRVHRRHATTAGSAPSTTPPGSSRPWPAPAGSDSAGMAGSPPFGRPLRPSGVAVDPSGDVAHRGPGQSAACALAFLSTGLIDTVARATAERSLMVFGGDGGPATSATFPTSGPGRGRRGTDLHLRTRDSCASARGHGRHHRHRGRQRLVHVRGTASSPPGPP